MKVDQSAKYFLVDSRDRDIARVCCGEELLHGNTGVDDDDDDDEDDDGGEGAIQVWMMMMIGV